MATDLICCLFFFFTATATTEIYTLSLHDALPILAGSTGAFSASVSAGSTASLRAAFSTAALLDRKSTRLNSSHVKISYAVFCLKKKNKMKPTHDEVANTKTTTILHLLLIAPNICI